MVVSMALQLWIQGPPQHMVVAPSAISRSLLPQNTDAGRVSGLLLPRSEAAAACLTRPSADPAPLWKKFNLKAIQVIRDPVKQVEMVGVPEEYLSGIAFHMYHLTSPDNTVSFEFQHNVCGRSIYAQGTIDVAFFLMQSKADKRLYNMIDVLREGEI